MANQDHFDILKQGVEAWNSWRQEHPEIQPDLSDARLSKTDLTGIDLRGADLSEADLSDTDLSDTNLVGVDFSNVNLCGVDFSGANLSGANLSGLMLLNGKINFNKANLSGADLSESFLGEAIFSKANLSRADLSVAGLPRANFTKANLNNAKLYNADLSEAIFIKANLSHADFEIAILNGANFSQADLSHANFDGAELSGTNLNRVHSISTILIKADLSNADLSEADLTNADLSNSDLSRAKLLSTNLTGATLTNCMVYGIASWDVLLEGAKQDNLVITLPDQPTITVDNLKVAQFIYLLLNNQELRDVLNAVMERSVLLLGRFNDGGHELLQAIAKKLREMKYLPMIFDFDRPDSRNLTETVVTLVGLSRFVIADLSGRSVANELRSTVPHFRIPFVPIIEESRKKEVYSMFSDFLENDWILPLVTFTNRENLIELLPTMVIEPAEKKCEDRQIRLNQIFNR